MSKNPNSGDVAQIQTGEAESEKLVRVVKVYDNLDQNVIRITEDKIRLILKDHLENIENKKAWTVPLGVFVSLLLIPITTEKFRDAFSISPPVWEAGCYMGIILSFIWLVKSMYKSYGKKSMTIDDVIDELKKNESNGA